MKFRIFASAEGEGRPPLQAVFVPSLDKQTEWARIELNLAPLAGHDVGIQLAPSANQEVWTLMRDPKIVVIEDRAPQ
ncbi:phage baseplate assembly protein V [Xanthomonas citri]|uniref:phage baseplate assembly protein V n=1 Tax=Xanthomonas citri TaxID=346 RepID=UPI001CBD3752|nr:phage baseplate assembly protein V [Xanthomonas citri]